MIFPDPVNAIKEWYWMIRREYNWRVNNRVDMQMQKKYDLAKARLDELQTYQPHFAWLPIRLSGIRDDHLAWLETVYCRMRRRCYDTNREDQFIIFYKKHPLPWKILGPRAHKTIGIQVITKKEFLSRIPRANPE